MSVSAKILNRVLAIQIQHAYSKRTKKNLEPRFPIFSWDISLASYLAIYHENIINQVGFIPETQAWFNSRKLISNSSQKDWERKSIWESASLITNKNF